MKACFYTLGCKVNQYETHAMRHHLEQNGFETADYLPGETGKCDLLIINSCTVTGESDRKLRQLLRRCRREQPEAVLVLSGCMPQAFPDKAAEFKEADIIVGNAARRKLADLVLQFFNTHQPIVEIPKHDSTFEELPIGDMEGHTRAFVKIEDGCNRFCSYCIIPYARGRVRSRSLESLRQEVTTLAAKGYREIVLVGINLTAFGQDCGLTLADAVDTVCAIDGIERVRLGSIEPDYLTPPIIKRLASQPKLCPQFHLALQSGCDATLKRMNRHYTTAEYAALCKALRAQFPGCAITTDFMVGFPGETEEEFESSLSFVKEIAFARVHIFAYSRRPGTPADRAPDQVQSRVKAERSRKTADLCQRLASEYAAGLIGKTVPVLLETKLTDGTVHGYSPEYVSVKVKTDAPAGTVLPVLITGEENGECIAVPAE
ncbi:MAG: tRNA (N(6)-L-threonylcarbamoyladenosine(37)-C(2))-methylthiotransferase MtaB [Clostridia bacterium]|nr:tRNA (N(6)-L-threonylcarbamoyladenosine(37)-C(2))-methylthiotransferase MtaB [Clostridia bacterium]